MKKKTDIILIVITVILVAVLIGGFIYDRNSALLARTNLIAINGDDNLKLEKMNKAGFLYRRAGYEAKLRIKNGHTEDYIIRIARCSTIRSTSSLKLMFWTRSALSRSRERIPSYGCLEHR